jgi:glycine cleavage system aminomethyltransferase T
VNTLRIEKGFKMWGNEMNCDVTILEAGLDGFVRWKKKVREKLKKAGVFNLNLLISVKGRMKNET